MTKTDKIDHARKTAQAVGDYMFARDNNAHQLGIRLEEIGPGYAKASMLVTTAMLNSHGILHGGMSFTLADTAFAYACNSYNRNAVAMGCNIIFPATGAAGDRLTAEAVECLVSGRAGVYDVTVKNQDGKVVALFRGQSRQIEGAVISDAAKQDTPSLPVGQAGQAG
ncbi:MAG TPA: hydroxyphenylacetyl-CoA thioesterase PaaI [Rhodospirillaceae bacterium]|nr:hydroxyphenylacetyl-CoA thioesterase PaaI [Rhodospirillaceae bacterium]